MSTSPEMQSDALWPPREIIETLECLQPNLDGSEYKGATLPFTNPWEVNARLLELRLCAGLGTIEERLYLKEQVEQSSADLQALITSQAIDKNDASDPMFTINRLLPIADGHYPGLANQVVEDVAEVFLGVAPSQPSDSADVLKKRLVFFVDQILPQSADLEVARNFAQSNVLNDFGGNRDRVLRLHRHLVKSEGPTLPSGQLTESYKELLQTFEQGDLLPDNRSGADISIKEAKEVAAILAEHTPDSLSLWIERQQSEGLRSYQADFLLGAVNAILRMDSASFTNGHSDLVGKIEALYASDLDLDMYGKLIKTFHNAKKLTLELAKKYADLALNTQFQGFDVVVAGIVAEMIPEAEWPEGCDLYTQRARGYMGLRRVENAEWIVEEATGVSDGARKECIRILFDASMTSHAQRPDQSVFEYAKKCFTELSDLLPRDNPDLNACNFRLAVAQHLDVVDQQQDALAVQQVEAHVETALAVLGKQRHSLLALAAELFLRRDFASTAADYVLRLLGDPEIRELDKSRHRKLICSVVQSYIRQDCKPEVAAQFIRECFLISGERTDSHLLEAMGLVLDSPSKCS